ncbi:MAG: hypothetical protein GY866_06870, partial [Proteobacteria bacterium]|nr:hypothetical protein [Pseudomonadota bacterium]
MPVDKDKLPFEFLQDFQIKYSLLTVDEEKEWIVADTEAPTGEFPGLRQKEVLVKPAGFTLGKALVKGIDKKGEGNSTGASGLVGEYTDEAALLKAIERATGRKVEAPLNLRLIRKAVNPGGLRSYWNSLRIIAYHSFRSRKIVRKGEEIIPIKTKRQFEYHFRSRTDPEGLGEHDPNFDMDEAENGISGEDVARETVLCFDGAEEVSFEAFYEYVLMRICGRLDRQRKRGESPPLMVWRKRFKDELTVFFKSRIGGNGYAKDYQDSRVRELQREGKRIKGLDAAGQVKQAFVEAIESEEFSHREYTCLIARNRGYSFLSISRFTGFEVKEV